MMNFYKRDTLNDKFEEFEKRFQLKLDEQNITHNTQIQKLNDKIARLETENSRTYELIDKLYEYRFQEINNNTAKLSEQMSSKLNHCISVYDNKLENTFTTLQKVMLLTKEKISVIMDKLEICMNESKNIEEQINTLTKQQETTNEKLVALNNNVSELDDKIDVDVCELYEKIDGLDKNIDENNWSVCYDIKRINETIDELENSSVQDEKLWDDIKTLNEKINILTTKQSLTDDILLNIQNDIILINTHSKLGNKSQQNLNNEISEKIKILTDNVSNIQNINNKFDREIHKLTTQQQVTTENLNALQHTNTWSCIITDNLEICMNAIKRINVFEEPMFGRQMTRRNTEIYNATNRYLGTSIISLDTEPHEFSYINQFYNLQVLVINNWNLFNYGVFCPNNRSSKADNFKMMCDRYGEMNNKTLETFIIHCAYDFNTWCSPGAPTHRREPLLLEYLCMQLKNFPSLKIVKLYYLDLPLNIGDIIINNLENMRHVIKELHIISNTIQQASRLKMYCDNKKIILKEVILLKDKSVEAFQRDVITPLNQKRIDEDGGYMRRNKIIDRT
jgi:predicted  nucleic acid-binding Zn-ribbon protein